MGLVWSFYFLCGKVKNSQIQLKVVFAQRSGDENQLLKDPCPLSISCDSIAARVYCLLSKTTKASLLG